MSDQWVFKERNLPSFSTQMDIKADGSSKNVVGDISSDDLLTLLRLLVMAQNRQNELLEEVVEQLGSAARQRSLELASWKQANPRLARACKAAAEKLGRIQTDFIDSLSDEIEANFELLSDGEFVLNEFVDRFGPRFVHLNTILQVLTQLGNAPDTVIPKKTVGD